MHICAPRTSQIRLEVLDADVQFGCVLCGLLALALLGSVLTTTCTILSLHFGFLDKFLIGTSLQSAIGFDFFSVPRGFIGWCLGLGMFRTWDVHYGPYAVPYFFHPVLSFAIGSWLSLFSPWQAYRIFVALTLLCLFFSACVIIPDSTEENKTALWTKRFLGYLLLSANFPTYLMIWNAQMHIFTVVGLSLVLAGLHIFIQQEQTASSKTLANRYILLGLLASLFSKPILLLALPFLLGWKQTRGAALKAVTAYLVVSIAFLSIPLLNPGAMDMKSALHYDWTSFSWTNYVSWSQAGNILHWLHLFHPVFGISVPNTEYFSPVDFWGDIFAIKLVPRYFTALVILPPLIFFCTRRLGGRLLAEDKSGVTLLLATLVGYYCAYPGVWEYHYASLYPLILFLALSPYRQRGKPTNRSKLSLFSSKLGALSVIFFFLPTPFFLFRESYLEHLVLIRAFRIVPVFIIYFCLLGAAFSEILRENKEFKR